MSLDDFELPAAPVVPEFRRPSTWPPQARIAGGCGLGCIVLVLLQAVLFSLGTWLTFGLRPPEGLNVQVQPVGAAVEGQKLPLRVTVRNDGDKPFTLHTVTVRSALLRDMNVDNPQPAPAGGKVAVMGSTTWQFNQAIQPGKTWTVRFDAIPKRSGTIRGVIEVQVNVAPKGVPFTVEVKPAAGATPAQPGSGNRDGGT